MALRLANANLKKDWVTTVTGIVTLIIPILSLIGIVTPEQATGLQSSLGIIVTSVTGIIGAVASIILLFSGSAK